MLQPIGRGPRPEGAKGVVPRLLDCHDRIRRFTGHAIRLGSDTPAPPDQVAQAAAQVLSYFDKSLPHHSADEDESVAPRLPEVPEAAHMTAQHIDIHATVDELIPLWRELVADPARRDALRPRLAAGAAELKRLFDRHLDLEESTIFPAIEQLSDAVQEEIVAEMIARRFEP